MTTTKRNSAIMFAFSVDHDCDDPLDLPITTLVAAALKRLEGVLLEQPQGAKEAFEVYDTCPKPAPRSAQQFKVGQFVSVKDRGWNGTIMDFTTHGGGTQFLVESSDRTRFRWCGHYELQLLDS